MGKYPPHMQQVLIFDYDGVIVDSLPIFMDYFIDACKKQGYSNIATKKEFLRLFNGNMFEQMMKKGMGKKTILNIVYTLKKGLIDHQHEIKLFPEIKQVLEKLTDQHTLIISTSNETTVVSEYLKQKRLYRFFNAIYGSDVEPSKVKKIELIKQNYTSNKYTYIGDTVGDIKEGKQAQIQTVATTWGWHSKEQLLQTNPDYVADQPYDLLSLFIDESLVKID
jgi:phosphoglycolate phosphatase